MTSTNCIVVGVFSDNATADRVADRLAQSGIPRSQIHVSNDAGMARGATASTVTGSASTTEHHTGFLGWLEGIFGGDVDDDERNHYVTALDRGSAVVSVTTDTTNEERVASVMNQFGAVDIDRHAGSQTSAQTGASYGNGAEASRGTRAAQTTRTGENVERSIPVVQEELRVGKRPVQRGGVRVYNHVTERPVEENVTLREERVRVDRRPVNRPATEADLRMRDEVVEVTAMAEEAVVDKRTRVVEEVVIAKDATQRTETVRDKVRQTDVKVEPIGATASGSLAEYDEDFRTDFRTRFAGDASARWETYQPAYQYGYRMASDDRYRGRRWEDVESTLQTDYMRNNPNSAWDRMKGAVRYGWEKVTGRR